MLILKSFSKILYTLVFFLVSVSSILAFSYYSTQTQSFDTSLSEKINSVYTNPTKIYVTQVVTESESLLRNPEKWVKALYYYNITRLHFSDLPYTYLLDENGIIYQGKEGGIGANPELREVDGAITIGYMSNNSTLTNRASESLKQVVEEISYEWGISQLLVVKLNINQEEGKLSTVSAEETTGEFSNSVIDSLSEWGGYKEENLTYKARIEEVVHEQEIGIGERLKVKVKVKNLNDFTWFTDKDPIYISTKDGVESSFAINQEWKSFSKPVSVSELQVPPGGSVEFEFQLQARVLLGEAKESYEILKFEGKPFEGSSFEVRFNISRGEQQLVEIASPRYEFANIRECNRFTCKVLESADNGMIFILVEEQEGWSKIKIGDDLYGWINSTYLKKI
jgi:hypothetical protein